MEWKRAFGLAWKYEWPYFLALALGFAALAVTGMYKYSFGIRMILSAGVAILLCFAVTMLLLVAMLRVVEAEGLRYWFIPPLIALLSAFTIPTLEIVGIMLLAFFGIMSAMQFVAYAILHQRS